VSDVKLDTGPEGNKRASYQADIQSSEPCNGRGCNQTNVWERRPELFMKFHFFKKHRASLQPVIVIDPGDHARTRVVKYWHKHTF
jgi:hypothetical protein